MISMTISGKTFHCYNSHNNNYYYNNGLYISFTINDYTNNYYHETIAYLAERISLHHDVNFTLYGQQHKHAFIHDQHMTTMTKSATILAILMISVGLICM